LDRIAVPTLLIHACDDPFIRLTTITRELIAANPQITLLETQHGGHCAFLAAASGTDDGYWAELTALKFILQHSAVS
jgi:predicted alpha/beta-fold hydrolase